MKLVDSVMVRKNVPINNFSINVKMNIELSCMASNIHRIVALSMHKHVFLHIDVWFIGVQKTVSSNGGTVASSTLLTV